MFGGEHKTTLHTDPMSALLTRCEFIFENHSDKPQELYLANLELRAGSNDGVPIARVQNTGKWLFAHSTESAIELSLLEAAFPLSGLYNHQYGRSACWLRVQTAGAGGPWRFTLRLQMYFSDNTMGRCTIPDQVVEDVQSREGIAILS